MTHNRKPDVLPVEGASIAEALKALASLEFATRAEGPPTLHINKQLLRQWLEPIRSALERAAAEGEAWRVIEEWCQCNWLFDIALWFDDETWTCTLRDANNVLLTYDTRWDLPTRLEALQAAAEWVKAQALPAPPKGSTP